MEGVRQLGEALERSEGWAIELPRLRKVVVEREVEVWKAAREVRNVCMERDTAKAELESIYAELVSARRAVNCEELKVWRFGALVSHNADILILIWDHKMAMEEQVAVDKREGATFLENKWLAAEVKSL